MEVILSVHFFFELAIWITMPCLLIGLVKKYRKKALVPPMIAFGLTTIIYSWAFIDLSEMIYLLETIVSIVIFAICYVLYAYLS